MISKIEPKQVEKPWGRTDLGPWFACDSGVRVGEVIFSAPGGDPHQLLVKYLFTREALSVQVHPGDNLAKREGRPCGKEEAWLILHAEPDARVGLGLQRSMSKTELAATASTLDAHLDWKRAKAGDVFHVQPGTIHAIGGGIILLEIQQNSDVTYRLYDYGRPRDLHLALGVEAAIPSTHPGRTRPKLLRKGHSVLLNADHFTIERFAGSGSGCLHPGDEKSIALPIGGEVRIAGEVRLPGTAWRLAGPVPFGVGRAGELIIASPTNRSDHHFWQPCI